jgi:membrane protein
VRWAKQRVWLGSTVRTARGRLRGTDLLLNAAGVTFYATLAAVPTALLTVRLTTFVVGRGHMLRLGHDLADAVPSRLGAPPVVLTLVERGVNLSWWTFVIALFPASLYGEGLRRSLMQFGGSDEALTGWRGRLSVAPLLVVAPALLFVLLAATPRLNQLFGHGGAAAVGGVVLAFAVDWLVTSVPLVWIFRVVAPDPPGWLAALVGGVLTGSFVAGFLQGFVLFLSLPIDIGRPFGGLTAVGGLCALELWAWVLHLVVLLGYVATRSAPTVRSPRASAQAAITDVRGER